MKLYRLYVTMCPALLQVQLMIVDDTKNFLYKDEEGEDDDDDDDDEFDDDTDQDDDAFDDDDEFDDDDDELIDYIV